MTPFGECIAYPPAWAAILGAAVLVAIGFEGGRLWERVYLHLTGKIGHQKPE